MRSKQGDDRNRSAPTPSEIPARGWKDILKRCYQRLNDDRILAIAAGVKVDNPQQSVPQLFLAGFPAGILIGIALAIYVVWYARVENIPITAPAQRKDIISHLKDSIWSLLAPIVILGGIYGGIFTPTEAAGVACIYAIVVSMFIYRELTWRELWSITVESSALIAQILIIVGAAGAFAWLITTSGFPGKLIAFVDHLGLQTWMLLLVINIILLFVGSVLEPPAAMACFSTWRRDACSFLSSARVSVFARRRGRIPARNRLSSA